MNDGIPLISPETCTAPEINSLLTEYYFGHATDQERATAAAHLLVCEVCWRGMERLDDAVRVLRSDRNHLIHSLTPSDIAGAFGISRQLHLPIGGHLRHVIIACGLFAALYAVALLVEVAYQFDRYWPSAGLVALLVFIWIFLTSVGGLAVDWRLTKKGSRNGLLFSAAIFLIAAVLLFAAVSQFLPATPITVASYQTSTAQAAYLKTICSFLILEILFLLPPFHFIITMQRELLDDRHRLVKGLLTDDRTTTPQGLIYPKWGMLGLLLAMIVCISIFTHHNLLGYLRPGPYMSLFLNLLQMRLVLWLAFMIECLIWYRKVLNELKHECLLTERMRAAGFGG